MVQRQGNVGATKTTTTPFGASSQYLVIFIYKFIDFFCYKFST